MKPRRAAAAAAAVAALAAALAAPAAAPAASAPPVTPADLEPHLAALAAIGAGNGGTRAAATPGYDASAAYVAERLRAAGWRVRLDPVPIPVFEEHAPPVLDAFEPGRDHVTVRFSAAGDVTGPVRTIRAISCSSSALRRIRPGDVVLWPGFDCSAERASRLVARRGGAALVVDGGPDEFPLPPTMLSRAPIPVLVARSDVVDRLPALGRPVRVHVDAMSTTVMSHNVIAELPGRGRSARRVIMAGGHLDSVREGPGLNDNGSGVAALLAVAQRLPAARRRATLRMGFWTAEEDGLIGSERYVRGLSRAQRRRIVAYVNYDMVGSPNAVPEVYDTDDGLERLLRRLYPGREGETSAAAASDQLSFAAAGIRVSGFYTGSSEEDRRGRPRDPCYHRACDDLDNVDRTIAARAATALGRMLATLAARRWR